MTPHDSSRLTVGIVGAGQIVRAHLPVLQAMSEVSVAWITDASASRAQDVARAYRVPVAALPSDLSQLPTADIVLLAIPYGARPHYYDALRSRSCSVYVEKPFALNASEHERLCTLFPGNRFACGYQFRHSGRVQLLRQIIQTRLFGRLRKVNFGHGGPGIVVGSSFVADVKASCGGALFEVGVHGIDATLFCTQARAAECRSVEMEFDGDMDIHTHAQLTLSLRDGESIEWEITVSSLVPTLTGIECVFENATTFFSLWSQEPGILVRQNGVRYTLNGDSAECAAATSYQTLYLHWMRFIEGIRSGSANATSASQSLATTRVIEDVYRAGRATREVRR